MAVDVSGSPPGGAEISGEGSEGCTGHQLPAARPCATTATLCWTRFTNEIWIWTANPSRAPWYYGEATKAATFSSEVVCFYIFLRKFRGESVQIKSEEATLATMMTCDYGMTIYAIHHGKSF
jgi:hypothetical protein